MEHSPSSFAAPTLLEQHRIESSFRAQLQLALRAATGVDPSEAELDLAVREEFSRVNRGLRLGQFATTTPSAAGAERPHEANDTAAALRYAQHHQVPSLLDAVRAFRLRHAVNQAAPLVPECVEEFLTAKKVEGRSPVTLFGYTAQLRRFAATVGHLRPGEVTDAALQAAVLTPAHPRTRLTLWHTLRTFFRWCVSMRYVNADPLPRAVTKPRPPPGARLVLKVPEAAAILQHVAGTDQLGFWVLALFGGLRTEEIRRLQREAYPWEYVRLDDHVIDLPDHVTKTRARRVPMQPVLREWLKIVRAGNLPLMPRGHFTKCRTLRERILAPRVAAARAAHLARAPGYRPPIWGYNIARRTYISYRIRLAGASYADVSEEVGNSEEILRAVYVQRTSRAEARAYFALTPAAVSCLSR
jgi:hypothetical protein